MTKPPSAASSSASVPGSGARLGGMITGGFTRGINGGEPGPVTTMIGGSLPVGGGVHGVTVGGDGDDVVGGGAVGVGGGNVRYGSSSAGRGMAATFCGSIERARLVEPGIAPSALRLADPSDDPGTMYDGAP